MNRTVLVIACSVVLGGLMAAQKVETVPPSVPPAATSPVASFLEPPAPFPGLIVSDPIYPFPPEKKAKFRDAQVAFLNLELEIRKHELEIMECKLKQKDAVQRMQSIAYDFALDKKIDMGKYEMDGDKVEWRPGKKSQ
jgi:hypothetical protein